MPDTFVETSLSEAGILALSLSGYRLVIDPATGGEIRRDFVK